MAGQAQSNGRAKSKRPLSKLIEKEENIIADSDSDMNPNFAGRFTDDDGLIAGLKEQIDSLQQQVAFLTENAMEYMGVEEGEDDKVDRQNLAERIMGKGENDDEGLLDTARETARDTLDTARDKLGTARDKIGTYLDPSMVSDQLSELREQVAQLTKGLSVDTDKIGSFKNDVVAPAIATAMPLGLGKVGEAAVKHMTLDRALRYGVPAAILMAAIKLSSSKGAR